MRTRSVLALALTLAALLGSGAALADVAASRAKTESVGTARWSVVLTSGTATSSSSGSVATPLDTDTYWWISNNGTATLNGAFTIAIQIATTGGATAYLEECRAAPVMQQDNWDTATGVCNGTISTVAYPNTSTVYVLPASYPPGAAVRLRMHVTSGGAGNSATMGVTVVR